MRKRLTLIFLIVAFSALTALLLAYSGTPTPSLFPIPEVQGSVDSRVKNRHDDADVHSPYVNASVGGVERMVTGLEISEYLKGELDLSQPLVFLRVHVSGAVRSDYERALLGENALLAISYAISDSTSSTDVSANANASQRARRAVFWRSHDNVYVAELEGTFAEGTTIIDCKIETGWRGQAHAVSPKKTSDRRYDAGALNVSVGELLDGDVLARGRFVLSDGTPIAYLSNGAFVGGCGLNDLHDLKHVTDSLGRFAFVASPNDIEDWRSEGIQFEASSNPYYPEESRLLFPPSAKLDEAGEILDLGDITLEGSVLKPFFLKKSLEPLTLVDKREWQCGPQEFPLYPSVELNLCYGESDCWREARRLISGKTSILIPSGRWHVRSSFGDFRRDIGEIRLHEAERRPIDVSPDEGSFRVVSLVDPAGNPVSKAYYSQIDLFESAPSRLSSDGERYLNMHGDHDKESEFPSRFATTTSSGDKRLLHIWTKQYAPVRVSLAETSPEAVVRFTSTWPQIGIDHQLAELERIVSIRFAEEQVGPHSETRRRGELFDFVDLLERTPEGVRMLDSRLSYRSDKREFSASLKPGTYEIALARHKFRGMLPVAQTPWQHITIDSRTHELTLARIPEDAQLFSMTLQQRSVLLECAGRTLVLESLHIPDPFLTTGEYSSYSIGRRRLPGRRYSYADVDSSQSYALPSLGTAVVGEIQDGELVFDMPPNAKVSIDWPTDRLEGLEAWLQVTMGHSRYYEAVKTGTRSIKTWLYPGELELELYVDGYSVAKTSVNVGKTWVEIPIRVSLGDYVSIDVVRELSREAYCWWLCSDDASYELNDSRILVPTGTYALRQCTSDQAKEGYVWYTSCNPLSYQSEVVVSETKVDITSSSTHIRIPKPSELTWKTYRIAVPEGILPTKIGIVASVTSGGPEQEITRFGRLDSDGTILVELPGDRAYEFSVWAATATDLILISVPQVLSSEASSRIIRCNWWKVSHHASHELGYVLAAEYEWFLVAQGFTGRYGNRDALPIGEIVLQARHRKTGEIAYSTKIVTTRKPGLSSLAKSLPEHVKGELKELGLLFE